MRNRKSFKQRRAAQRRAARAYERRANVRIVQDVVFAAAVFTTAAVCKVKEAFDDLW